MSVREAVVETVEASIFRQPAVQLGSLALDKGLEQLIKRGGLEVTLPDGTTELYGEKMVEDDGAEPRVVPELAMRFNSVRPILRAGLASDPSLIVGEGYMRGDIDFEDPRDPEAVPPIDRLLNIMDQNGVFSLDERFGRQLDWLRARTEANHLRNQSRQVRQHYDISNDFYGLFLDASRMYSCAIFEHPDMTLEDAQNHKVDLVGNKLRLQPGDRVLDIGSGWGYAAIRLAQRHNVEVLGITLSPEQLKGARQLAEAAGVTDRVRFERKNIAELAEEATPESFDAIYSIGMYEHMGQDGQDGYFAQVGKLLRTGRTTVLHAITQQHDKPASAWVRKYIFPGGHLHPIDSVSRVAACHGFRDQQTESLRLHYAKTLDEWWQRYEANVPRVREMFEGGRLNHPLIETGEIGSAEEFVRMWRFYLATSSGSFRYGHLNLAQHEWTKGRDPSPPSNRRYVYAPETVGEAT